ncbi:MAG: UbiA family prenyltransferase [Candidatus Thermoplasmatota archaeon]|nr:UbiA family prenyltransferase [Candidatus Thermoplasmatota archaeon]
MGHPIDLLRLGRVHTAAATAAIPGLACYLAGGTVLPVVLVTIGAFFHHAWGFSLNEVMDLDIDREVGALKDKPLVSGRVGKKEAYVLSTACLLISFCLFAGASLLSGVNVLVPLCLLLLSTIAGGIYDILGKRFILSDIFVALWMFFLVLSSASTVGNDGFAISVWAVVVLSSVHILFNNSVEGGLKDVENDRKCRVPTLAVETGCNYDNGKLTVTLPFFLWAVVLRGTFVAMASAFAYLISDMEGWGDWFTVLVSILGISLFVNALGFLREGGRFDRERLVRTFAVHEMASFALSLLVVLPTAGPIAGLVTLLVPVLWFVLVNRVIYGSEMSPKV